MSLKAPPTYCTVLNYRCFLDLATITVLNYNHSYILAKIPPPIQKEPLLHCIVRVKSIMPYIIRPER